ncbi:MAG: ATPase [Deltaproteobacteria bacterium]|nr:ATPase [Deltaproteobacteria bacterium]
MAVRGIREYDGKKLMASLLRRYSDDKVSMRGDFVLVDPQTDFEALLNENPWLGKDKLVAKPDMLFGKRGKNNLLKLNATWEEAVSWIRGKMAEDTVLSGVTGKLTHFLVEPFIPHEDEYYIAIRSFRDHDVIYFSTEGGVNVEENWEKVKEITIPVMTDGKISAADDFDAFKTLPLSGEELASVAPFVNALYKFYFEQGFAYLEINPFAIKDGVVVPLDLVAKLDDTAAFENLDSWGRTLDFPAPFGRTPTKEEAFVKELDSKTGASLKLTVLNPAGRIWPMIAGGGASVIYADTVSDLGYIDELGMYGEYSGDPNEELTYQYACTVLDLITRNPDGRGKALLIGGGIANFTDVAKTFTGIIRAVEKYRQQIMDAKVKIFVRRGGPNYKVGLEKMRNLGDNLGVPIEVYGPETHMSKIVPMAIDYING